jgi:hypothetical protein
MLLRMLLTWWQSCEPITTQAKPRLSTHTSSGKYCDSFHSRTMQHLDIIRVLYLPTDAQENFFKKY